MEHTSSQHNIKNISDVLNKIKNKEISVHSKTFFRLQWLAFGMLVVSICLVSVLLCSFILFTIDITGQPYLIDFGTQGLKLVFFIFPWMLFMIDVVLIFLLVSLTRHTSFGYKIPGIYILLGTFCIIGISGYVVETKTAFHRNMFIQAHKSHVPFVGPMYKKVRPPLPPGYEIYRGMVTDRGAGFVLVTLDTPDDNIASGTRRVYVRFASSSPQHAPVLVGQTVLISGKIVEGQIVHPKLKVVPRLPLVE